MKKLVATISLAGFLGILQSAYFAENSPAIQDVFFSYIPLAALVTGYVIYLLFNKINDLMLASLGSVVIGAVIYNISALVFDHTHVLQLLEPLMALGAATGVLSLLVQVLSESHKVSPVKDRS